MRKRTVRRLELMLHIVTALILIIKGLDLVGKHAYTAAAVILGLGLLSLVILLLRKELHIRTRKAHIICFYIEAPALIAIAWTLLKEGNEFLPYIFLLAGLIYPMAGFISSKKFKQIKKPPMKRRLY